MLAFMIRDSLACRQLGHLPYGGSMPAAGDSHHMRVLISLVFFYLFPSTVLLLQDNFNPFWMDGCEGKIDSLWV